MELYVFFFFVKQKTAYELRISDWSSDVCSSDLRPPSQGRLRRHGGRCHRRRLRGADPLHHPGDLGAGLVFDVELLREAEALLARYRQAGKRIEIGRASCRGRVWPYV